VDADRLPTRQMLAFYAVSTANASRGRETVKDASFLRIADDPAGDNHTGIDTVGLVQTVNALREKAANSSYRVLITKAPPALEQEAQKLPGHLIGLDLPLCASKQVE
jgi:hypothetical protein